VLLIEDDDPVRVLTLNRPDARDALSIPLLWALHTAVGPAHRTDRADDDPGVVALDVRTY
jgi:enoyl-CoA hydratase/carnithine racemase